MDNDNFAPWPLSQPPTREEWICIQNIKAFERMILEERSEIFRAHLKGLLNEEHRKLRAAGQAEL